jgi:RsiW-degrading membrane proteinase PrsW (M82 family)
MQTSPAGPGYYGGALPTFAVPPAQQSPAVKWMLIIAACLAALFIGLLTLFLLGLSTGLAGLLGGIVLALLPLPFYLVLVVWIDRFEKEPLWMLAAAFIWGATAAVFIAYIFNNLFAIVVHLTVPGYANVATAVISAPIVEELAKATALIVFYLWQRDQFDSVLDGIIYAAMVGLGFAMTENILYYGNAFASGGLGASIFLFVLRGVVSPFAHPLFTSMTGIGLGVARLARSGSPLKFIAPALGIAGAMFLHGLWNLSASFGAVFFIAYVLVMVPAFLGLVILIAISLKKEGRIVREHLALELQCGFLSPRAYESLCTVRGRLRESWQAIGRGGYSYWRIRTQFHDTATELAFHRWRTSRGIFPRYQTPAAREAMYMQRLASLRNQLGGA